MEYANFEWYFHLIRSPTDSSKLIPIDDDRSDKFVWWANFLWNQCIIFWSKLRSNCYFVRVCVGLGMCEYGLSNDKEIGEMDPFTEKFHMNESKNKKVCALGTCEYSPGSSIICIEYWYLDCFKKVYSVKYEDALIFNSAGIGMAVVWILLASLFKMPNVFYKIQK